MGDKEKSRADWIVPIAFAVIEHQKDLGLTTSELNFYITASSFDFTGQSIYPSYRAVAQRMGLGRDAVRRAQGA